MEAAPRPPNLHQSHCFDRLGGVYSIATVVDDFIERLLVNDTLNANPAINEARARVPKAGLKFHVTALVCEVTGGPSKYSGRSMKDAHAHLNINEAEWQAMVSDFRKTLDKFQGPSEGTGRAHRDCGRHEEGHCEGVAGFARMGPSAPATRPL